MKLGIKLIFSAIISAILLISCSPGAEYIDHVTKEDLEAQAALEAQQKASSSSKQASKSSSSSETISSGSDISSSSDEASSSSIYSSSSHYTAPPSSNSNIPSSSSSSPSSSSSNKCEGYTSPSYVNAAGTQMCDTRDGAKYSIGSESMGAGLSLTVMKEDLRYGDGEYTWSNASCPEGWHLPNKNEYTAFKSIFILTANDGRYWTSMSVDNLYALVFFIDEGNIKSESSYKIMYYKVRCIIN